MNRDYEPPAPFIKVLLISKNSNIRKFLDLHIDTGASSTIILDRDVRYLGSDIKSLKKAKRNIGGIGGLIDTYLIKDAIIIFKTEEGMIYEERLNLLVKVHKLNKLTEEERRLIIRFPSLLGRNVLRKFRLIYDERSNEVFMKS